MINVSYVFEFFGGVLLAAFLVLYLWPIPMTHALGSALLLGGLGLTVFGRAWRNIIRAKPWEAGQKGKAS